MVVPLLEVFAGNLIIPFDHGTACLWKWNDALILVIDRLVRVTLNRLLLVNHLADLSTERLTNALQLLNKFGLVSSLQVLMRLPKVEGVLGRVSRHVVLLEPRLNALLLRDLPEQFGEELAEVLERNVLLASAAVDLPSDKVGPLLAF